MKRLIPFIALLAAIALVGCSGDSPSARPVPTVVPDSWSITSLTPSNTTPYTNTVILIEATVTRNGSAAPDGTTVRFTASGGVFSNGTTEASVLTDGGVASAAFLADTAGSYVIQAQVGNASRQVTIPFTDRAATDALQLFSIDPRRGSYAGGEQAVIVGKGILAPVEVFFDLNGTPYQAIVAGVSESVPASENGSITVITPAFTGADSNTQQAADVRVIANAGTGSAETATLTDAYSLLPGGGPQIFGVSPNSGRSSGGEIVNILGQNFGSVAADLSVSFIDGDSVVRLGTVVSVAPDGSQIQVETPRFSTLPLEEDRPQDVTVSTIDGSVSLEDAFIVLADNPQPEINSVSPTSGPIEGGTLVTIFGRGFQAPMQVFFGALTATDVNIFDDTTPANQDRITCVTPNYSQQPDVPPVTVDVTVRNMNSGAEATMAGAFTFGEPLYITGNSPQEGGLGDLVIIYGSGFEDPLQVHFPGAGGDQMQVMSVAGTEILVRIPDDLGVSCAEISGSFNVTLLDSGDEAIGGSFTIRGNNPQVLSVDPVLIQEADLGTGAVDITINGQFFAPDVLVGVGSYIPPSNLVTVLSDTTIEVDDLPSVAELGASFATTSCTIGGAPGQRSTSTPIDVTVTNFPGNCGDTLTGAIVIEPTDSTCTALPAQLQVEWPQGTEATNVDLGDAQVGGACATQTAYVRNIGGMTATNVGASANGTGFSVTGGTCNGSANLNWDQTCTAVVEFCATSEGVATGTLSFSFDGGSVSVGLSGNGTPAPGP